MKQNDEQDNVYDGYFLINLSDENLPKNLTIPLEIETPSGKLATDISLEQLPTKGQAMDVHQTVRLIKDYIKPQLPK
ncbi:hypothetical protein FA707_03100 [Vagococcus zengguangii]|uniref:Uncharacterized protein n=1 Tax=Vagococcus zengguangii TaxID=2571750 RepID=A0A4D7CPL8_9ENTE|nr:hypothetical protein [Vagococcus zengguangii]QCI86009.1 hypothetical protein FA707_03100 [Vagococcus zengguangii]